MQQSPDPPIEKFAARRPMEMAFRAFIGEALRVKRDVLAAPSGKACDVIQQRILEHFRTTKEPLERRLSAHDARFFEEVKYLMIAAADEAFLQFQWAGRNAWSENPLEAQEHHTHDAGERIFRELDEVLERRANKPTEVLLVYLHVLSIGFKGRYAPIDPMKPEEYRRRLVEHLRRLGERLSRDGTQICPEALQHTLSRQSRLQLQSLARGMLPLLLAVGLWLVLGLILFQWRTDGLAQLLERIEGVR